MEAFREQYGQYFKDESRTTGYAESISFPATEEEVRSDLKAASEKGIPVTVQGARTGLAGGCVPYGGHILNTALLDRVTGMTQAADGTFFIRTLPGVSLQALNRMIEDKSFPSDGWDEASLAALEAFKKAPAQFFPPDPTEKSAFLGGIAACNASGAKSYLYGGIRPYVEALRLVLPDGDVLSLRRGECVASGRALSLSTEGGRTISVTLPSCKMPDCKNASGYYIRENMDAVDLIVGSDGTLGVISELTLRLLPAPKVIWGCSLFFKTEDQALRFTEALRPRTNRIAAIEYFDGHALTLLRTQKENNAAFSSLPDIDEDAHACIYTELHCASEEEALSLLYLVSDVFEAEGGDPLHTWVARTDADKKLLQFFRHAVPESANMLIDVRRQTNREITKLGSDMSVPDGKLLDIVRVYRDTIAAEGFESATWGHIGNNHLHVNILPRNPEEHARGKQLFARWAQIVSDMGGAVSAEHGVGKIKRGFLETMYGKEVLSGMAKVKAAFDPLCILGRGNLFPAELVLKTESGESS